MEKIMHLMERNLDGNFEEIVLKLQLKEDTKEVSKVRAFSQRKHS